MKKNALVIAAAVLTAGFWFTSCETTREAFKNRCNEVSGGLYLKEVSEGMIENPTPENSVLVYGFASEPGAKFWFRDENSDWQATVKAGYILMLPPVHKGASIVLEQGGILWEGSSSFYWVPVTNDEYNVQVPKDKSLYFMGMHSVLMPGSNTFEGAQVAFRKYQQESGITGVIGGTFKTQKSFDKGMLTFETFALKKLLKKYKKTEWEPVILERLAEVKRLKAEF